MFAALVFFLVLLQFMYQARVPDAPSYYSYEIVATYPHDDTAFTQGLEYRDGLMYESTGLYGRSSLRVYDLETGEIENSFELDDLFFGEGMTVLEGEIFQLTWKSNTGFIYDLELEQTHFFNYAGQGWGLTNDGEHLIMSNGSSTLSFLNPSSLDITRTIEVIYNGTSVTELNELEYVDGVIYANVWHQDQILMIDPVEGSAIGWIDLEGIQQHLDSTAGIDVLNGIAYNYETGRLLVTGKLWPNVFEIELVPE